MAKYTINQKREKALYEFANTLNENQRKKLLTFVLAIITNSQIKTICSEFKLEAK
jgi:hypothetical protein